MLKLNTNVNSNANIEIDTEKQKKRMNELNGKIYELKKDCYKFVHFYLTYIKIVDDFYNFDSKSVNMLNFLKVCVYPIYVFCKQVLEIVNRGFKIEQKFDKDLFETEAMKKGICTTSSINLLDVDQQKTREKRRRKGGKGYVLKTNIKLNSVKLIEQVISYFNNLFTSLHNIFNDIDKNRDKYITTKGFYTDRSEVKISHIYTDFHNYVNNPFKYLDFLVNPDNYVRETKESLDEKMYPEESSAQTRRRIIQLRKLRKKQMTELFGKTVTLDKFKKEKYRKILGDLLTDMAGKHKSEPKLTLPSKKRSIEITDDYDLFGENFAKLYKLLLKNLENLIDNKSFLILAIVKEKSVFNKIKAKLNDKAFESAKQLIEDEEPDESAKNKRHLIPNYISQLFINECIDVIETLPCLTEEKCEYDAGDLPDESVLQNSTRTVSTKPTSANNNSLGVNSNEFDLDLEEASYRSGKVESSLKSINPKSEMVTVKTAVRQSAPKPKPLIKPKPTLRRKPNLKPKPKPKGSLKVKPPYRTRIRYANSVKKSSVKKSSIKNNTPDFFQSARRKLKSVKKTGSDRSKTVNPELLEFLKAREGLRKTSVKLYSPYNVSARTTLENSHYTSTSAGSKSKKSKKKSKSTSGK